MALATIFDVNAEYRTDTSTKFISKTAHGGTLEGHAVDGDKFKWYDLPADTRANDDALIGSFVFKSASGKVLVTMDDIGSVMVAWDNGCGLSVAYGEDACKAMSGDE